jgi:hypothetical protein
VKLESIWTSPLPLDQTLDLLSLELLIVLLHCAGHITAMEPLELTQSLSLQLILQLVALLQPLPAKSGSLTATAMEFQMSVICLAMVWMDCVPQATHPFAELLEMLMVMVSWTPATTAQLCTILIKARLASIATVKMMVIASDLATSGRRPALTQS